MKLTYYKSNPTNFGDELNAWLWPRILPEGFLDENDQELFVGIGSILEDIFPHDVKKFVMGSGYAGYEQCPDLKRHNWEVIFVRGPRTAKALGLSPEKAICDSAVLLRTMTDELPAPIAGTGVAFMPHFDSVKRGNWDKVCARAGITYLDPTAPPERLMSKILGADLVLTEAMHGAIVSDTLRVPWAAIKPFHAVHRNKWADWSEALGISVAWNSLVPSSFKEVVLLTTKRGGHKLNALPGINSAAVRALDVISIRFAARRLKALAGSVSGQLSEEARLDDVSARARRAVDAFVAERRELAKMAG